MLDVRLHHFVQPWKPHFGMQVLLGLGDTLASFVRELDYLILQSPMNYNSWTSDYQPSYNSQLRENGVIQRPELSLLLRREVRQFSL